MPHVRLRFSLRTLAIVVTLTHVLPDRFQRVRHYGFLANRGKGERLACIRRVLG